MYFAGKLTGRGTGLRAESGDRYDKFSAVGRRPRLRGHAVVFIPAWREDQVIGTTISHAMKSWPHQDLTLYVGCYRNDLATQAAVIAAAGKERRVRLVVCDASGPTSKADCLNRLYQALREDEARRGFEARMVVLHDAEDMVDAGALALMDQAMDEAHFIQLPVLAMPHSASPWIAGHYSDEFAEAHGKAMVVRDLLGAAMPGAGVGCAVSRGALAELAAREQTGHPFADASLTEDYELGLKIAAIGGKQRFLRVRDTAGNLIATRAYFPASLSTAVRQKTRWTHGIALQGWDRLGWEGGLASVWMQMRDRRGPFAALLLMIAYALILVTVAGWGLALFGHNAGLPMTPTLESLLWINFGFLLWRAGMRFAFTAREFGLWEGFRAVLRIPVSNIIHIMAGRRAVVAYCRALGGTQPVWDKTDHASHPALPPPSVRVPA